MLSPLHHLCFTKTPIDGQLVCLGLHWGYYQLKKKLQDVQENSDEFRTLTEQKDVALKDRHFQHLSTKTCFWMHGPGPENGGSTKTCLYSYSVSTCKSQASSCISNFLFGSTRGVQSVILRFKGQHPRSTVYPKLRSFWVQHSLSLWGPFWLMIFERSTSARCWWFSFLDVWSLHPFALFRSFIISCLQRFWPLQPYVWCLACTSRRWLVLLIKPLEQVKL